MIKLLQKTLPLIVIVLFLASCSKAETIQPFPTVDEQNTPTVSPSLTASPTVTSTSTVPPTPNPTTVAQSQARIEAFDSLCKNARKTIEPEISPDEKWIAAICDSEDGKEESPLQVLSIDRSKDWKIYYNDYTKGDPGDSKDGIMPYRWSKDGKYLYAAAGSRNEGCCWTGGKYVLLVRLNLETGEQAEFLNSTNYSLDLPISFSFSDDDRYLLFTPATKPSYDFSILDLLSLESRNIKLNVQKPIDLEYAVMSPDDERIVLPLYKLKDFGYVIDSILLINLPSNEQKVLVSDLQFGEELYPIRWIDKEHVLLSNMIPGDWIGKPEAKYWSLDTNTGERKNVEKPQDAAQQSVHRTAGGLRVLSLVQARNLVPFRWLVLPAAGNAGR